MDLQDFKSEMLYFEEDINPKVVALVNRAAADYGEHSEGLLLEAHRLDKEDLTVLVGLYRLYYFQQRYQEGIEIAHEVMQVVGQRLKLTKSWQDLQEADVARAVLHSFCMVRLYFFALKAAGYLHLRQSNLDTGRAMLEKVRSLDYEDRIGAGALIDVLNKSEAEAPTKACA